MLKRLVLGATGLACLGLSATCLRAEEVEPEHISAQASWLTHVNFDAARESEAFSRLETEKGEDGRPSAFAEWMDDRYGMKPKDVSGLTMYGVGADKDSTIALLYADYAKDKVLNVIERQPGYRKTQQGEYTLHTWMTSQAANQNQADSQNQGAGQNRNSPANNPNQPGQSQGNSGQSGDSPSRTPAVQSANEQSKNSPNQRASSQPGNRGSGGMNSMKSLTVAFVDERLTVFGPSPEAVSEALKEIKEGAGLANNKLMEEVSDAQDAILYGVVLDFSKTDFSEQADRYAEGGQPGNQGAAAGVSNAWSVFDDMQSASFVLGEEDNNQAYIRMRAVAATEKSAEQASQVVQGLQALAAMSWNGQSQQGQQQPQGQEDMSKFLPKIEQDGQILTAEWKVDANQLVDRIERQIEQSVEQARESLNETFDAEGNQQSAEQGNTRKAEKPSDADSVPSKR